MLRGCWLAGLVAVAVACRSAPSAVPPAAPPSAFTITAASLGPLTSATPATLHALRHALAGYDVAPVNDGGLEYRVTKGGARVLDVVPTTGGKILNVHATSPTVAIADRAGRAWTIGAPLASLDGITTCECWGEHPVCFTPGEHVAIGLARGCRASGYRSARARRALVGARIERAIWSPQPLVSGGILDDAADDGEQREGIGPEADAP